MKLKPVNLNLFEVINDTVKFFKPYAEIKNIDLQFNSNEKEILVTLDKDKIEKISNNVLSNAIKFTPEGGSVHLNINVLPNFVEIKVIDTGIGIPKSQLGKIFDRFYQVDSKVTREFGGTGVGLSLTKELVELHKGKILVESEEGIGSEFTLLFPVENQNIKIDDYIKLNTEEEKNIEQKDEVLFGDEIIPKIKNSNIENDFDEFINDDNPSLLVVEDNSDLRNHIGILLKKNYKILKAKDGEEGIYLALEHLPEIIICDIMMPKLDGLTLCKILKNDERTSHIPILLLTAKTTMQDKIEGLESGADDYLTKPFDAKELEIRLKNILEQRKKLHLYFRKNGIFDLDKSKLTSSDNNFLNKVLEIVNENLQDPNFNVESFAKKLIISRSLLHKKLTSLTGESACELIKKIRLNKAAELIKHKSGNISEIAYDVGFNDPSYFTLCFKKQFGQSPSQYH